MTPPCDMFATCPDKVTMIDQKGYVYCENHGMARRNWMPCRKLRSHELARLARGETIARY